MKNKETYKISSEKCPQMQFLNLQHSNSLKALVYIAKQHTKKSAVCIGDPNGIRTRVAALRGPRPRPLDDGTVKTKNVIGYI